MEQNSSYEADLMMRDEEKYRDRSNSSWTTETTTTTALESITGSSSLLDHDQQQQQQQQHHHHHQQQQHHQQHHHHHQQHHPHHHHHHLSIKNEGSSPTIVNNRTTTSSSSSSSSPPPPSAIITTSAAANHLTIGSGLRKKQSQRFTVTHNHHPTTPSEPVPFLPPVLANNNYHHHHPTNHLNQDFTASSLSSTSDSDHHPSSSGYPSNPQSTSTTSNFDSASILGPFSDSSTSISRTGTSLSPAGSIAPPNPIGSMSAINMNPVSASPGVLATPDAEDEIIPTAIVIKNIPFSVRREQLLTIIEDLMIPLPYAFNYHFDNGVFRGLAFANFRSSAEADAAVAGLNGFDISGRKLRVEYKKVLQAGEKERIEKEKAIKRMRSMQLQRESSMIDQFSQQPPLPMSSSSTHITFGNYSHSEDDYRSPGIHNHHHQVLPSPIPHRASQSILNSARSSNFLHQQFLTTAHDLGQATQQAFEGLSLSATTDSKQPSSKELDMNDPQTLELYSRIVVFKEDNLRDELSFAKSLSGPQRRIVHQIAKKLGLEHRSEGLGDDRFVVVAKPSQSSLAMPRINRVASSANMTRVVSSQPGAHYLGQPPRLFDGHNNLTTANLLKMKKSMPDMRMREMNHTGVFYPDSTTMTPSMKDLFGGRKSNMNLRELSSAASQSKSLAPFSFNNHYNHHQANLGEEFLAPVASNVALFSNQTQNLLLGSSNNNSNSHNIIRQPKGPEGGSGKGFGNNNLNSTQQQASQRGLLKHAPSRGSMNNHHVNDDDDRDDPSSQSNHHQNHHSHHLAIGSGCSASTESPPLDYGTHSHHHQA